MKEGAAGRRTPMLDSYSITHIFCPEQPDIERWIDRERRIIYVNTGARPGAKIVRLIP